MNEIFPTIQLLTARMAKKTRKWAANKRKEANTLKCIN